MIISFPYNNRAGFKDVDTVWYTFSIIQYDIDEIIAQVLYL